MASAAGTLAFMEGRTRMKETASAVALSGAPRYLVAIDVEVTCDVEQNARPQEVHVAIADHPYPVFFVENLGTLVENFSGVWQDTDTVYEWQYARSILECGDFKW